MAGALMGDGNRGGERVEEVKGTEAHPVELASSPQSARPRPERKTSARRTPMVLTPAAIARVRQLLDNRGKPSAGIRIGVRTKGCSGLSYSLEFADAPVPGDEVVTQDDVTLLIDPKAILFIIGTEMDYVEEEMQSGFVFRNPNEKGRCGCGESFHV